TFDPGSGANDSVSFMIQQPDGKLLVGGKFTAINGVSRNRLARVHPDGSLDPSFNPDAETGALATLASIALQADGKLLVGGTLTNSGFQPPSRILRLHGDGSRDTTFSANVAGGEIKAIVLQPNGKILVGGSFSSINSIGRQGIARLNSNGSLDTTFAASEIALEWRSLQKVYCLELQSNGKVLIGASFYHSGFRTAWHEIVRLNSDGSIDASFDIVQVYHDGLSAPASFRFIVSQQDGKILIGGHFNQSPTNRLNVVRLNADGKLDLTFDPGAIALGEISCAALQSDGSILLGGNFRNWIRGISRRHVLRLDPTGGVDNTFEATIKATPAPDVTSMVIQPDGKVLLASASFYYSLMHWEWTGITRVNPDGNWDSTFDPGRGASNYVMTVALQSDGKVLIGGLFYSFNDTNQNYIARLNSDGSLDDSFQPSLDSLVRAVIVQPDGKILVGGAFASINGTNRKGIGRLNADGSLDETFDPGTGVVGQVYSIALQPDGKLLLGGNFVDVNGMGWFRVARLNQDGSADTSFNPGSGINDLVRCIVHQSDGKILLGGRFSSVDGTTRNGVARLNADGSLDTTFDPGTGVTLSSGEVHSLSLQQDEKVLIGGSFSGVNGQNRNGIARLNTDGTLDNTFDPGAGVSGLIYSDDSRAVSTVSSIVVQPNGRIIIAGNFKSVDGVPRQQTARLLGDPPAMISAPVKENGEFVCLFQGFSGLTYTLEYRDSLSTGTWHKLSNLTAPDTDQGLGVGVFELRDPIPASGMRYYRVVDPAY
ncbi:MAG: hypothetical protein ACK4UN_14575, partial [Limisphaerales bacterium]